jgi:UrcA family protein
MLRPVPLALAAALLSAAAPAFAQDYQRQVVSYADLDVDSDPGVDVLLRRIRLASENVCGHRSGPRPLTEDIIVKSCVVETTEDAVNEADIPHLTARYYGYQPEVIIDEDAE